MRGSDKELQLCAPIAQLVEQMTLNHWVLGSSPRGRTIFLLVTPVFDRCFFMTAMIKKSACSYIAFFHL